MGVGMEQRVSGVHQLTERERQVLRSLMRQIKIKAVAAELGLSLNTIEAHLRSARAKLGVSDSISAARRLADSEAAPHGSAVTAFPDCPPPAAPVIHPPSDEARAPPLVGPPATPRPVATRGRPWNAMGLGWRLVWPLVITIGLVLAAGMLLSGLTALSDLVRGAR